MLELKKKIKYLSEIDLVHLCMTHLQFLVLTLVEEELRVHGIAHCLHIHSQGHRLELSCEGNVEIDLLFQSGVETQLDWRSEQNI